MTMKTYTGGCHCGAVRFEADLDLSQGTTRCNCSICSKARAWFVIAPTDKVRMIKGEDAQTDYQWIPPGQAASNLHYRFCKQCGIRTAGLGEHGPGGKQFYFIAVADLEGTDPDELAASLRYVDGASGHYDRKPDDIRPM